MLENTGKMRSGDNFLDDTVPVQPTMVRDLVGERVVRDAAGLGPEMPLFLMEKGFSIGNEVLEVADLRKVDGRVVYFGDRPVPQGEPYAARRGVGRTHAVFVPLRPAGLDTRFSEGLAQ